MSIKHKYYISNIAFVISALALSTLLCLRAEGYGVTVNLVLTVMVACVLAFAVNIVKKTLNNITFFSACVALTFSIFTIISFSKFFYFSNSFIYKKLTDFITLPSKLPLNDAKIVCFSLAFLSLWAVFIYYNYFFNTVGTVLKKLLASFSKVDYLYIVFVVLIFAVITVLVYNGTNAFYAAEQNNKLVKYDVIFTTDSSNHIQDNVFMNINAHENDLRQPLFAVFALPFAVVAKIISTILFNITNIYPIAINIIQVLLLTIGSLIITKLLDLKGFNKYLFLTLITISYSYLVFSVTIEQYVFAFFWLILFVYSYLNNENQSAKDILFIAATGSLLTSGVIFVLLSSLKNIKKYVSTIMVTALKFFSVVILFSQTVIFINFKKFLTAYSPYTGQSLSFIDKLYQYFNFIAACLIKPQTTIDFTSFKHVSYQLMPANSLNLLGVFLLLLAVVGFISNYKNKYALICFCWLCYSFIMLTLIGWGTTENGLILYSLYFSWAFISLWYFAIKTLFKKSLVLKNITLLCIIAVIGYFNIEGFMDLIKFAFEYYPR
ncbi:hypothetical protein IMX26_06665 [Clostridium sp. 'deep sea']|uniref:hypothetical protein n=1 Tax=Clostridium sp. 'deep sea' TaxID=2779445 RepID=UPI001896622B|nr:hypothetical protein [Clostridium sp. 'deep sea']QOR36486.1 hypothetical protein IMX26_06665 [Clostridium sp. 'deep sea']